MDQGDDPYKLLGVSKDATESEVKKAYRKLALEHHPDRQANEDDRVKAQHVFAQIAGAYEILMDEGLRKEYDESQKEQARSTGQPRGFDQNNCEVQFNDPYEVFKRNFKDEFGFEYPGAKFDFAEVPEHMRLKNKAKNQKMLTNGEHVEEPKKKGKGKQADSGDNHDKGKDGKRGNGILTIFKGNKDRQVANRNDEDQLPTTNSNNSQPNNRPTSMETTTKKIEHEDGTIETVTEIKITRPDGSTETCRTSDKADKRPGWQGKNQPKQNMLTNGNQPKGLLTNGNQPKGRIANGKKVPLLTNGKNDGKKQKANAKASKQSQMVPYQPKEQPLEQPKKRGMFGFGKAK